MVLEGIMTFTLRELADKFGVNLKRVRRWSQGILPPDPRARRQAGLSREYTHNEAFTLLLAGYLVNNLPLTIIEVKEILGDIDVWMKENNFTKNLSLAKAGKP